MSKLSDLKRNLKILNGEKPEKYNVLLFGASGRVGSLTADKLIDVPEIRQLVLLSRNLKKPDGLKEQLTTEINNKGSGLELIVQPYSKPEEFIEQAHISIIFSGVHYPDRIKCLDENLIPIRELAKKHKNFKGTTIIGANPTDILSYIFALYSENNPNRVVGMNYLDTKRARKIVYEALQERGYISGKGNVKLFVVGQHEEKCVVPVFSSAKIDATNLDVFFYKDEDLKKDIEERIKKYAPMVYSLFDSTAIETADAVKDVVKAIISEEDIVTLSTFLKKEGSSGIYIGWPVRFNNFCAKTQELHLNDKEQEQFDNVWQDAETTINEQRCKGKITGYIDFKEEPPLKVSGIDIKGVSAYIEGILKEKLKNIPKMDERRIEQEVKRILGDYRNTGSEKDLTTKVIALEKQIAGLTKGIYKSFVPINAKVFSLSKSSPAINMYDLSKGLEPVGSFKIERPVFIYSNGKSLFVVHEKTLFSITEDKIRQEVIEFDLKSKKETIYPIGNNPIFDKVEYMKNKREAIYFPNEKNRVVIFCQDKENNRVVSNYYENPKENPLWSYYFNSYIGLFDIIKNQNDLVELLIVGSGEKGLHTLYHFYKDFFDELKRDRGNYKPKPTETRQSGNINQDIGYIKLLPRHILFTTTDDLYYTPKDSEDSKPIKIELKDADFLRCRCIV